jgi:hypothetical protein
MLILPPNYPPISGPLIFLAGPIQGAEHWQAQAAALIQAAAPELAVASPRRPRMEEEGFSYGEQVDWESHHLRLAGRQGVVLFWLARETTHYCERAYAQTTRFELAEWKMRHERDGARLALGIEQGFSGARYIQRRFAQDCPSIPIWPSLAATCAQAVALCRERA